MTLGFAFVNSTFELGSTVGEVNIGSRLSYRARWNTSPILGKMRERKRQALTKALSSLHLGLPGQNPLAFEGWQSFVDAARI